MKKTLVIGASENPEKYSNKAIRLLREYNYPVEAIGGKKGMVEDVEIHDQKENFKDIDTVTLYINPRIQSLYYDYIIFLKPKRIIFNPGTENEKLKNIAEKHGIIAEEACTLVLLKTDQY